MRHIPRSWQNLQLQLPSHSCLDHRLGLSAPSAPLQIAPGWVAVVARLEVCTQMNLLTFKNAKYLVLHLGWGNPQCQCRPSDEQIESNPAKKDLVMFVDKKLVLYWKNLFAAQKSYHILDCIQINVNNRSGEVILSFSILMKASLWVFNTAQENEWLLAVATHNREGWNTSLVKTGLENWSCSAFQYIKSYIKHFTFN